MNFRLDLLRAGQQRTAQRAESAESMLPEVLYDLAVIHLANGDRDSARAALERAIREELDLALPGEVVVRFTNPEGLEEPTPVENDGGWTLRLLFPDDRTDGETR